MSGKVIFVGAGAGSADLLTLRAVRCLERADVVLHDDLVAPEALDFASPKAIVRSVGKRCGKTGVSQETLNRIMVEYASRGKTVVRLKSGDPGIFGRLGEEIEALQEAAVAFEIVPGVSAAFAAAAAVGTSLTDRRKASRVVFAAASLADGKRQDWASIFAANTTVAIYMPANLAVLAAELKAAGVSGDVACAVVSHAGSPEEGTVTGKVSDLGTFVPPPAPAVVIIGEVVARKERPTTNNEARETIPVA